MVLLTPEVTLVVHPIDTDRHPSVPPGWRWAVQLGGTAPSDMAGCVNAGWCPTRGEASLEGEMVAVTVVKALRAFGIPAAFGALHLDSDPIPAGGDRISIGG
jgi:hypothetical protein